MDDVNTIAAIADAYGHEKVEDLLRSQETQSYYILTPDQLDSDDAIAMVERTPAYKRDKRKAAQAVGRSAAPASNTIAGNTALNTQNSRPANNNISFSLDDTE